MAPGSIPISFQDIENTTQKLPVAVSLPTIHNLKQQMLDLTNAEREKAGSPPVRLGHNPAAQLHADAGLQGCYFGHWDQWGLKPNHRYTLAGGTGAEGENVAGLSYCINPSFRYLPNTLGRGTAIEEIVASWMDSPGHRRTLLDPAHTILNLGIAFDHFNAQFVQQFSSDYVTYSVKPHINEDGHLIFQGTVADATLHISPATNFQIAYDRPAKRLSSSQIAHTYNLCNNLTIGFIRKPAPPGHSYSRTPNLVREVTGGCTDPYQNDPSQAPPKTPYEALQAWETAKKHSEHSGFAETRSHPPISASLWKVTGNAFHVNADITPLVNKYGAGIYTLRIWGEPSHMDHPTVLSEQTVFWRSAPPTGHPYQ